MRLRDDLEDMGGRWEPLPIASGQSLGGSVGVCRRPATGVIRPQRAGDFGYRYNFCTRRYGTARTSRNRKFIVVVSGPAPTGVELSGQKTVSFSKKVPIAYRHQEAAEAPTQLAVSDAPCLFAILTGPELSEVAA